MRSQLTFHPSHSFVHIYAQGVVKNSYCVVIGSMIGTDSILFRALDIGRCVSVCFGTSHVAEVCSRDIYLHTIITKLEREKGWVKPGDSVVCVHGMQEAVPGSSNMLRVMKV